MKIIFAGTPEFAILTLKKILRSHHKICAVYTKPDKPAGRGQKLTSSPVKIFALNNNLDVYQPPSLKDPTVQKQMENLNADILVNVAYGLLLPEEVLNIPKFGCINIHPSLLPRWRGTAPIQRSILAGDTVTGVTIMKMDTGLDTGDIFKQKTLPITTKDNSATIFEKTAEIGANLLFEVLNEIEQGVAKPIPQDDSQSTYADKLTKEEAKIDWHKSAKEIDQRIRAFNPWPVAYTEFNKKQIRIWEAEVRQEVGQQNSPGTIIKSDKNGIEVATDEGVLAILKMQLPGGKILSVSDILNAHKQEFSVGKKL